MSGGERGYRPGAEPAGPRPNLLQRVHRKGPLPGEQVFHLAVGTAAGLAEIHKAGSVHGNVSPFSVVMTLWGGQMVPTWALSPTLPGIPAYQAPERLDRAAPTLAGDVYAWGATVGFAAAGRPPFGEGTVQDVFHQMRRIEPDLAGLPTELRAMVMACLVWEPEMRPTAAELTRRLTRLPGAERPADPVGIPSGHRFPERVSGRGLGPGQRPSPRPGQGPSPEPAWPAPAGRSAARPRPPPRPASASSASIASIASRGDWTSSTTIPGMAGRK